MLFALESVGMSLRGLHAAAIVDDFAQFTSDLAVVDDVWNKT